MHEVQYSNNTAFSNTKMLKQAQNKKDSSGAFFSEDQ